MTAPIGGDKEGTPITEKTALTHQTKERPIQKPGPRNPSTMQRAPLSPTAFVPPVTEPPTEQLAPKKYKQL